MATHQQRQAPCLCFPDPGVGPTDEQELFLPSQRALVWATCQWTDSLTLHLSQACLPINAVVVTDDGTMLVCIGGCYCVAHALYTQS